MTNKKARPSKKKAAKKPNVRIRIVSLEAVLANAKPFKDAKKKVVRIHIVPLEAVLTSAKLLK